MSKLSDFFERLGTDAKLLDAYKKDPVGVMQANGVTDKEIKVVMSGNDSDIKKLLGDDKSRSAYLIIHANK
ncbi:hypothetical protein FLM48_14845 [Shewanella sp. Scap07]|uniref:hypothetical protein n=1 Tax=Shewanella sp. Scap07 TaxID=2589987 RepID=UPI0015C104BA|nr:hypothetical protein [Shewanella sp. Scap07]QLE86236.1 hypothetical protein FLM48_14845 [Shewanella sp. Scap07]